MKALIIGLGSIAKKHIHACEQLNLDIKWDALRHLKNSENITNVRNINFLNEKEKYDFVMITNPTSLHYKILKKSLKYKCPVFIEKPISNSIKDSNIISENIKKNNIKTYVACNLRFHPVIEWFRNKIEDASEFSKIEEINVYCGSYLPNWRQNRNFKETYSAIEQLGGGVHLDLIHELDFIYWIFGQPQKYVFAGRNSSHLNIEVYDQAQYWLYYDEFSVNISLNYFRRDTKRTIEILTETDTYLLDLINCKVKKNNKCIFKLENYNAAETYLKQMNYFIKNLHSDESKYFNSFEDGLNVLKIALTNNIWKD